MKLFLFLLALLELCFSIRNILQFGAIKGVDTVAAQFVNSQAIKKGLIAVNGSTEQRYLKIPAGTFYSMPIVLQNLQDIHLVIEGKLSASKKVKSWPKKPDSKTSYEDFIYLRHSDKIEISGGGKIDGRGYHWWIIQWLQIKSLTSHRPHLILVEDCTNIKVHDLVLKNSPSFHLKISGENIDIYNLDIKVNTTAQFNLMKKFSIEGILPTFPLNTDGVDPAGRHFHIYNLTVQNFDDVVVPKPSHEGGFVNCTQDMLIQNITIKLGVGLSIGSVPPNMGHNCIRNIYFKNANFTYPLKGLYLKTNPGDKGSGEIVNIVYENMYLKRPIWWAIYLGPQQQKQPGGGGPGCMLYPYDPKGTCTTQPLIDIRNISFQNVKIDDSLLFPIVMRCNQSNPCTGINFKNVVINKWTIGNKKKGYVCEHVKGTQEGGHPKLDCLTQGIEKQTDNLRDNFDTEEIMNELEKAVKEIGYEQQDDEMDSIEEIAQNWDFYSQE